MNEYLSAAELAQLNILSLPKKPKGISDKAKRECWPSRKRAQRGGEMEYQVAGLPEEIQTAVRERQAEQLLAQSQPAVLPSVANPKTGETIAIPATRAPKFKPAKGLKDLIKG